MDLRRTTAHTRHFFVARIKLRFGSALRKTNSPEFLGAVLNLFAEEEGSEPNITLLYFNIL